MTQPFILPTNTSPLPGNLTLTQFLQTVVTGVSGIPGSLVRPKWQPSPPKNPDIEVNWIAMGIDLSEPDANSYIGVASNTTLTSKRQEKLEVSLAIYGPEALETYGLIRDGFQIQQNLNALFTANMGFVEVTTAQHVPELVNERWIDRVITSIFLRRKVQRTYPVLTLIGANGVIYVPDITADYLINFETGT